MGSSEWVLKKNACGGGYIYCKASFKKIKYTSIENSAAVSSSRS
jgi:hypothetical protein